MWRLFRRCNPAKRPWVYLKTVVWGSLQVNSCVIAWRPHMLPLEHEQRHWMNVPHYNLMCIITKELQQLRRLNCGLHMRWNVSSKSGVKKISDHKSVKSQKWKEDCLIFLINKTDENDVDGVDYCVTNLRIVLVCTNNLAMMRFLRKLAK